MMLDRLLLGEEAESDLAESTMLVEAAKDQLDHEELQLQVKIEQVQEADCALPDRYAFLASPCLVARDSMITSAHRCGLA